MKKFNFSIIKVFLRLGFLFLIPFTLFGVETEIQYLSGRGKDNTVNWEFYCSGGRNSGTWTTIRVPSCWEQEGFGTNEYGNISTSEQGSYKYSFTVPSAWSSKRVNIVFDGSMTDTTVKINGNSAGAMHQGAFYRFKYDITTLLNYGSSNTLEVTVSKNSSNSSVNNAERIADYWVFGGIFRPVYLEAFPSELVERVAVNAGSNGSFSIDVYLKNIAGSRTVSCQVQETGGANVGSAFSASVSSGATKATLSTTISGPRLWSAETPNLYRVRVQLLNGSAEVHAIYQTFGFRTIEVRAGNGIYINGSKVMMKGADRHSFHPDSGRTLNDQICQDDVKLMKEMNMNAVRMSHYPPDIAFLDACDALGMYVLDELAGWQKMYDTTIATTLVGERVIRDVNHPSVIFWDNGNEGGWNTAVDGVFATWDPQKRAVLHPWAIFSNINTDHYESYSSITNILNGSNIYMTTEFLHGLGDGGAGAGLNDYWNLMISKPLGAGGFIWDLSDEGLKKTGASTVDTAGTSAPDGIVGPYREKEGSFFAIKEIWSPVALTNESSLVSSIPGSFNGSVGLTNRYSFTNLNQCSFSWKLVTFRKPGDTSSGYTVNASGSPAAPSIAPGSSGTINLGLPSDWKNYDALLFAAVDPAGKELYTWSWTIKKAIDQKNSIVSIGTGTATTRSDTSYIYLSANNIELQFSRSSGQLVSAKQGSTVFSLANGPVLAAGTQTFSSITSSQSGSNAIVNAVYSGNMQYAKWTMYPSGWVELEYKYNLTGSQNYMGVSFNYPEAKMNGVKWLGKGPYRVWKNRLKGVAYGVWDKAYNNTVTGSTELSKQYPEFKGNHASMYWSVLDTDDGKINVVAGDDGIYLRLYSPGSNGGPSPAFPSGDISFLDGIQPIGDKFLGAADLGPEGQANTAAGDYLHRLYFYFGTVTTPNTTPTPPGLSGDVNGSGTIDIVDALLVAQYYVGLNPSNFNSTVADVNCSGSIDIVDALLVAQNYVGLITAFPC